MGTKPVVGLAGMILAGGLLCGCCDKCCRSGCSNQVPAVPPPTQATAQNSSQPAGWGNSPRNNPAGHQMGMTDPNLQRAGLTQPSAQADPRNGFAPLGSST